MTIPYVTFLKHAQKVTKTAPASRTILKGVYHAPDGSLAVTDSHRLYVAKNSHSIGEQIIEPKTGATIEGNYPDTSRLLPDPRDAKYTARLNVAEAVDAFKALLAANKLDKTAKYPTTIARIIGGAEVEFYAKNAVVTCHYFVSAFEGEKDDDMAFNTQYFAEALALFKDVGIPEITMRCYGAMRPFTLTVGRDEELLALLLPIKTI